jgi:hypothetical protein
MRFDSPADISKKRPVGAVVRHPAVENPAVLARAVAEAILHDERFAPVESGNVRVETVPKVVRIHAIDPTVTDFLYHCTSGELEPTFVKISAELVGAGLPD